METKVKDSIKEQINELKKENNAVILAHYYVSGDIQDIADYVGDSFYLSKIATQTDADVIVMCGVEFMGESAKLLNKDKTVLLPDTNADCPMAHMCDADKIKIVRDTYDDVAVVCYINSTAELKSLSDVCVTSANAKKVVENLPNKNIYFIPDENLGRYIAKQLPDKHFIFNDGFCPIHKDLTINDLRAAKQAHPEALVLAHPECTEEILENADYIGSTSEIIKYAKTSSSKSFIIATETGVFHKLQADNPDKTFYPVSDRQECPGMKLITPEKVIDVLKNKSNQVILDEEFSNLANKPLEKMLSLSSKTTIKTDYVIVGCGVSGLYTALNLPDDSDIIMISKDAFDHSDSFLAQGGICVLTDDDDYDSYYEDTMKAGHYENNPESVDIMIRSSRELINDLINYDVNFQTKSGKMVYTKEGGHSKPRILFHEDITGEEITSKLLAAVMKKSNVKMLEYVTMTDLVTNGNKCLGIVAKTSDNKILEILAKDTILASGGIGGLYKHSTNFPHLTGDALELSKKYNIELEHLDYVQIHPTTLYSDKPGRRFLISESVRGEGAILLDKNGERFVNELLPRDILTQKIREQMEKDGTDYVMLSMAPIPEETILKHFPHIYHHCLENGYDVTKEPIPVVPAQHYFMGGIKVDSNSHTSMDNLYAVGETACNGVHGKNRLASNSLLESMVFAKRAALHMQKNTERN